MAGSLPTDPCRSRQIEGLPPRHLYPLAPSALSTPLPPSLHLPFTSIAVFDSSLLQQASVLPPSPHAYSSSIHSRDIESQIPITTTLRIGESPLSHLSLSTTESLPHSSPLSRSTSDPDNNNTGSPILGFHTQNQQWDPSAPVRDQPTQACSFKACVASLPYTSTPISMAATAPLPSTHPFPNRITHFDPLHHSSATPMLIATAPLAYTHPFPGTTSIDSFPASSMLPQPTPQQNHHT